MMSKKLTGARLAGSSPLRGRVENDYYATPPEATKLFLDKWDKESFNSILEPACGEGHLSKVLIDKYGEVVTSTDLVDRGYGLGGIDFLKYEFNESYDLVMTNPPFKYAQEFIEKAYDITDKYVVMFAKIQLLEGVKRAEMFDRVPLRSVYVHTRRVAPFRNGEELDENGKRWGSTMAFAWFVFEKGYEGKPEIEWL